MWYRHPCPRWTKSTECLTDNGRAAGTPESDSVKILTSVRDYLFRYHEDADAKATISANAGAHGRVCEQTPHVVAAINTLCWPVYEKIWLVRVQLNAAIFYLKPLKATDNLSYERILSTRLQREARQNRASS